jgi:hypothetical protein
MQSSGSSPARNQPLNIAAGSGGSLIEFEGLEPPKREAMYKYFDGIDNFYGRPEIKSKEEGGQGYIDLIKNWKFAS